MAGRTAPTRNKCSNARDRGSHSLIFHKKRSGIHSRRSPVIGGVIPISQIDGPSGPVSAHRLLLALVLLGTVLGLLAPPAVRAATVAGAADSPHAGSTAAGPAATTETAGPLDPDDLPPRYREWLAKVELLITDAEREAFLRLREDYERDRFIEQFWRTRDPDPKTVRNELRERWDSLVDQAEAELDGPGDERVRMLLLNGPPAGVLEVSCSTVLWPMEIWYYKGSDRVRREFLLVFYRRFGGGPYRLWHPAEGLEPLFQPASPRSKTLQTIADSCYDGRQVAGAVAIVLREGITGFSSLLSRMETPTDRPSDEWVATFDAYSTSLEPGAETFPAELQIDFPGRYQSRTVVQGVVAVPRAAAGVAELAGSRSYNFLVNGEVVKDGVLFENFRFKFDFPASQLGGDTIPLVFERLLRPDSGYRLIVKVEDLNGKRFFRADREIDVPEVTGGPPPNLPTDPTTRRLLEEANRAIATGDDTIKLIQPRGELLTDMVRFETLATGDRVERVTFSLNDQPILTDGEPPFSVELDLGDLPRTHRLRATAFDGEGAEVADDEILVNSGGTRFRVRLVEPRRDRTYQGSLRARAQIEVPDGKEVERLELFLNEEKVATLYDEPWSQPMVLPEELSAEGAIGYVRAVAYLEDGNSTEDAAFVNAPAYMEDVEVQFVELYTTVLDRRGRPVDGLTREMFQVAEDGERQEIRRFEQVRDLPIHAGILLDVSASMEEELTTTRDAALQFFQQIIRPKDRAAVITFNDRPNLTVQFTNQVSDLAGGLAGLKAERGTALYDSLIFSLYYFNGVRGQRALLLLSDGKDEHSRFSFDDALEYARRAGVTIYPVGLDLPRTERRQLTKLAEETGGQSFFIDSATELPAIYAQIEEELRSQYLIAYQSSNPDASGDFRTVELTLPGRPGLEVKTLRGYYP